MGCGNAADRIGRCEATSSYASAGREIDELMWGIYGPDGHDLNDIDELMPKIYPEASGAELFRRRDRLRRMTRTLVRRHRDKIERVACALLRHRTLSWRTIYDLLPEIPVPTPHRVELACRERKHVVPPPPDCDCELCVDRRRTERLQAENDRLQAENERLQAENARLSARENELARTNSGS
jgi:hypothetical protein